MSEKTIKKATTRTVASPQSVITDVPDCEEINADADNGLTVSDNSLSESQLPTL